jgi:hypothetical protein
LESRAGHRLSKLRLFDHFSVPCIFRDINSIKPLPLLSQILSNSSVTTPSDIVESACFSVSSKCTCTRKRDHLCLPLELIVCKRRKCHCYTGTNTSALKEDYFLGYNADL